MLAAFCSHSLADINITKTQLKTKTRCEKNTGNDFSLTCQHQALVHIYISYIPDAVCESKTYERIGIDEEEDAVSTLKSCIVSP